MLPSVALRRAVPTAVLAATLVLAACSPGDVELNGKLFDAMGVSGNALSERKKTPQLAERAPLVVPPSLQKLPPPETASTADADPAFPVNPEERSSLSAAELQRRQAEYCKVNYERPLALGDQVRASTAVGPLGSCAPSALKNMNVTNPLTR